MHQKHISPHNDRPSSQKEKKWPKPQLCFKTQCKRWDLKELLCKSHEVTGHKERNTTRMEKVLKRGAHTSSTSHHGLRQMRMRIRWESRGESWVAQRSTEKGCTRKPCTTNTTTDQRQEKGCETKSELREKREWAVPGQMWPQLEE